MLNNNNNLNAEELRIGGVGGLNNESNFPFESQFRNYQPLTNRLPIKTFRKRSISIGKKMPHIMHGSDQQIELVRLPPYKLAMH